MIQILAKSGNDMPCHVRWKGTWYAVRYVHLKQSPPSESIMGSVWAITQENCMSTNKHINNPVSGCNNWYVDIHREQLHHQFAASYRAYWRINMGKAHSQQGMLSHSSSSKIPDDDTIKVRL